ncbi:GIY-YIG nuclease family protein [Halovibrio sp. HP20-50]|uniref:GIY-YIG nuclease family protein n=1 Tax=Halovibrio sp. HP20-59 TaxID=3080275 RepID=UPI00294B166A|nr:GIY-YIG nuclease family protein [Halovibrio sp. HP20-59]MEA2120321.1 GIY-YIG nuclease family protein [Halovibrio sp. HP20-59]
MSTANNLYYVYMLTNRTHRVLYIGVTNNLERRLYEHRQGLTPGFASKYRCHKLVWLEQSNSIEDAIRREKQLKAGSRQRKNALVDSLNPEWQELAPY